MPEEEKKIEIIPMEDRAFKASSPNVSIDKEKARFRAWMEIYDIYSEDNPQPLGSVESGDGLSGGGEVSSDQTISLDAKLDNLGDAVIGKPIKGQVLSFDGARWVNLTGVTRDAWLPFNAIRAPGTKPATFKEWGISGAWEFSDATDDTIVANLKLPNDMDKTVAPVVQIGWSTNTAVTTETAVWQLEYLYTAVGEDTTANAQGTLTVNSNAVSQADGLVVASFAALAIPSSTDVCLHMRLKRLGAHGDDDLTDTAELHGLCMSYTSDKLGTAL